MEGDLTMLIRSSYWGRTNGDGEVTWGPGISQALHIKNEWEKERAFGIPSLDKVYTSPLTRALKTCDIAFNCSKKYHPSIPILVVENCREENGVYTYDKRRSRTYIRNHFPSFSIEDGFSEEDLLWHPDIRENKIQMAVRAQSVLEMIFDEEPPVTLYNGFAHSTAFLLDVCLTIHGGLINAFLSVLDCPKMSLPTGSVYPVVIRRYKS
ncbi:hypothetical protein D9756_009280 [Leucocoprinus leucothites]|uniref:Uncharacterized protein n=1 Tax=Leucocoprinus leucothites TaxID=201217 RepID=A0A8H5FUX6_9AGAR|nr:hypothetical protein D9756_009280 [Leucoagaricus leucothites]